MKNKHKLLFRRNYAYTSTWHHTRIPIRITPKITPKTIPIITPIFSSAEINGSKIKNENDTKQSRGASTDCQNFANKNRLLFVNNRLKFIK